MIETTGTESGGTAAGAGPMRLGARLLGWLALGTILFTGYAGPSNALEEAGSAEGALQGLVTALEAAYGLLALLAFAALIARSRWARPLVLAWTAVIVLTGGLAPVAWGGTGIGPGLAAGAVTALGAGLIAWLALRWSIRR